MMKLGCIFRTEGHVMSYWSNDFSSILRHSKPLILLLLSHVNLFIIAMQVTQKFIVLNCSGNYASPLKLDIFIVLIMIESAIQQVSLLKFHLIKKQHFVIS